MDNKIFLGKYRVSGDEIEAAGELTGRTLAYEAHEIDSGKTVVIELLPGGPFKTAERERLENEATAAKKLNHVNIPALYDFGVEDDHFVYVTEDLDGILAEAWVNTHGPLAIGPVLRIAAQVISALSAAAFHKIVHRAINPGNVVLVPGQTAEGDWPLVKVRHFVGAAPKLSDNNGIIAAFDKSLHYVSPEQIQDGTVDFRSEIYSLGCTMWFLLTGVPPLVGQKGTIALPPATAGNKVSRMSKKVRRLLAQMLSPKPEARPGDPLEFYRKLQGCLMQVERREAISRRFGLPSFSPGPADILGDRRTPTKALALAALFLMLAALTGLVISGYIRHRRIVRAEEPIGVPIGVVSAVSSATPVPADAASEVASNPTLTTASSVTPVARDEANATELNGSQTSSAVAQSNDAPSEPAVAGPNTTFSAAPPPVEATNAIASNTTETRSVEAQSNYPPSTPALPSASDPAESAPPNRVDIPRTQPPSSDSRLNPPAEVAANSTTATIGSSKTTSVNRAEDGPSPAHSPSRVAKRTARKKIVLHEVRRAEPVEPEVRRAQLAPPEEESGEPLPSRRRSVRGRFVGVTPDGRWMLELPSNKIIIVPPPQSYP